MNNRGTRLCSEDINTVYMKTCDIDIPWDIIIPQDSFNWLKTYEKANNCSIDMVMPALITLTSTICGPTTRVQSTATGIHKNVLNEYVFSISAPGSGKSNVFSKVITDVLNHYQERHGKASGILLEAYTTAGLQAHQQEHEGYGIITTDEGHRLIAAIQQKQSKGDSERALLCKLWGGMGDGATLVSGERSFRGTSMSLCCFIQPNPLLHELANMPAEDGFLDRILFFVNRPALYKISTQINETENLQNAPLVDFKIVFEIIDEIHRDANRAYVLSEEAQQLYHEYSDEFVEYMSKRYSNEDTGAEHNIGGGGGDDIPSTQNYDVGTCSSKDSTHVLRLTALIHIITTTMQKILAAEEVSIPLEIPKSCVKSAKTLYHSLQQKKAIFIQAARSTGTHHDTVRIPKVTTIKERICRAIISTGTPVATPKQIGKKLNKVSSAVIKSMLEEMDRQGMGKLYTPSHGRTKFVFYKWAPGTNEQPMVSMAGVSPAEYKQRFTQVPMDERDKRFTTDLCMAHPQHELLIDYIDELQH